MNNPKRLHWRGNCKTPLPEKKIETVIAGQSPHKFAFFEGGPERYPGLFEGRALQNARDVGPYVRLQFEDVLLLLRDGVVLRYYGPEAEKPEKHQMFFGFEDGSALVFTVQMYGAMQAVATAEEDDFDNMYYSIARKVPSVLDDEFTEEYFLQMCEGEKDTLSAKVLLGTGQRIPGVGNGVLQDILFLAQVHPKAKLQNLKQEQRRGLWQTMKQTMQTMAEQGGRNTEKNLFGEPGGYVTLLGAKTWQNPCPKCGGDIVKQAYLGGNIYVCPNCQEM